MGPEVMHSSENPRLLWQHKEPESTRMYEFKILVEKAHGVEFLDYESLRQWSVQNLNAFWKHVWQFTRIVASESFFEVSQ